MSRRFAVIGHDVLGDDVDGDDGVDGVDVMGVAAQVVGYDDAGYPIVVGARRKRSGGRTVQVHRPEWRNSQLAPGVIAPDEGMETLPMGNFTFIAAAQTNTFQGQVQKPFRGERWLIRVVRTGTTATGVILAQLFAGTDLAQLDVAPIDLESLADPNAFGTRLTHKPITPGVFMRAITSLSNAVGGTDSIFCSLQLLGRNVR
jgi:hypothetical protein